MMLGIERLREIAAVCPTPFHLYDERGIRETVRQVLRAFSWNPGFKEYYAVKANPNPAILDILRQEGCGVDCASMTELMLAEAVGFRGEEIMFSSNMTEAEEYEYARRLNAVINLDDLTHVDYLAAHGGIPENVCLRYNPGGELQVGNAVMGNPGDAKYGMTREQIFAAIARLRQLGARRFGLHALLASNATDPLYYPLTARMLFELAAEAKQKLGAEFFMINLSGGIGIPYEPGEPEADIAGIGAEVARLHREILGGAGLADVAIAAELGRYITGPHGCLVATAVHEKHIYKDYIGLDACAADLMRPAMYGAYHHVTVPGKEHLPHDRVYDVVGSLCENNDKFAVDRRLPEIVPGDLVVIHDTGAHGRSMGYNYNGKLRCGEVLLREDGGFAVIRRTESPLDYFATLDETPWWPRLRAVAERAEERAIFAVLP